MAIFKRPRWKYKNLTIVFFSIILVIFISKIESFHSFILNLGNFGYLGAFVAGIFFVSMFTAATSSLVLILLAKTLSPIEIGLIAGFGAVVGDLLIFNLIKDNLSNEIKDIYNHIDRKNHLKKLFHSKYFSWTLPLIGALIIASPLPDEIGVSLLSFSKMNTFKFAFISFILNSIGIFLIVFLVNFIRP